MIELKQLRKFVTVAEQSNFTRAAEILHIAQPALSRQIAQLEKQLGVVLIDRSARPFRLTEAGYCLNREALILLDRAQRMQIMVRQIGGATKRLVTIGFSPTIVYGGLPAVMHRIKAKLQHVEVHWREMQSNEQAEALLKGAIDIGFSRSPAGNAEIVDVPMREERLFAAIPATHGLAGSQAAMHIADLAGSDMIVYPRRTENPQGFANRTLAWLDAAGRQTGAIHEIGEIDTALALVAAGVGICLVPATARHLRGDVEYRLIEDDNVMLPVLMCHRLQEDDSLTSLVKAAVREFMAEDAVASLDPAYNRFHDF